MLRSSRAGLAFDKAVSLSRVHFLRSSASPTAVCNLKAVRQATSNARSQSTSAAASVTSRSTSSPLRFIVRENPSSSFNVVSGDHGERLVNPLSGHMDEAFLGKTGGEIFHEMMIKHKVTHIFGYPGGAILPVFDAIYKSQHLKFVLPRHEQGAGHMAEGYARASGKPGVVLVTSGPAATNVITPMADALADGVPMVVFTGQVATSAIGSDAFQEVDSIGLSRACTKWNVMVKNVAEVSTRISDAFEIAMSGRPGPVLVDLPKDVTAGILRRAIATKSALLPRVASTLNERSQDSSIRAIAHLINIAKKPVIYAGHGVVCSRGGPELLRALADKSSIPVATSLQGLGAFDELDEKSLRMLDTRESAPANMAMQEADLIIVLGSRFDDRIAGNVARFALGADIAARKRGARIVQFDIMPKNINKVVQVSEAVEGDVAANLRVLLPQVEPRSMADRRVWFDQINAWKTGWPLLDQSREKRLGILEPQTVVEELSKMLDKADGKRNTIVTTGVGQHQMWAAQHFRWRHSRSMITSGGLGTMGYGLPAAIGAKVARPDALVIDIDGDASFAMTLTELATAAQFNVGVKVLLFNNEEQGMATRWQGRFYEGRYARKHQLNTDFLKLAGAMGLRHVRRVVEPADVVDSLEWLVNTQGPALLEVVVDKKMPASPTVPAREGVHEIFV